MKKLLLISFLCSIIFISCKDNGTDPPPITAINGVYIINEGGYGQDNAAISFYNSETGLTTLDAYELANGRVIGNTANHMAVLADKGYISVNGSNKIEVINLQNFISEGFIDVNNPREVWIKDSQTAYVTSFSGNVIKFNPSSKTVIKNIPVGSGPEGIAEANGKLFVANSALFGRDSTISVIDLSTDNEILKIRVGLNPTKVMHGPDGKIYAISYGDYFNPNEFSGIYIIDPINNIVIDSIEVKGGPSDACFINNTRLLVSNLQGIMDIDLYTKTVNSTPLIQTNKVTGSESGYIYSLAYDEKKQEILCGNPNDFVQNGQVVFFDMSGNEKKRINTGINPGTIVIK